MSNPLNYPTQVNAPQGQLNAQSQTNFLIQGIQDPLVQQNFELMNKFVGQLLNGQQAASANLVFGQPWATNGINFTGTAMVTPGPLQLQIVTKGNPVRVKIAAFQLGSMASQVSLFRISALAAASFGFFGWLRNGVMINQVDIGIQATGATITSMTIPLPAFEFDDVVPSGTYTYQFFFQGGNSAQEFAFQNIQAVAYELR